MRSTENAMESSKIKSGLFDSSVYQFMSNWLDIINKDKACSYKFTSEEEIQQALFKNYPANIAALEKIKTTLSSKGNLSPTDNERLKVVENFLSTLNAFLHPFLLNNKAIFSSFSAGIFNTPSYELPTHYKAHPYVSAFKDDLLVLEQEREQEKKGWGEGDDKKLNRLAIQKWCYEQLSSIKDAWILENQKKPKKNQEIVKLETEIENRNTILKKELDCVGTRYRDKIDLITPMLSDYQKLIELKNKQIKTTMRTGQKKELDSQHEAWLKENKIVTAKPLLASLEEILLSLDKHQLQLNGEVKRKILKANISGPGKFSHGATEVCKIINKAKAHANNSKDIPQDVYDKAIKDIWKALEHKREAKKPISLGFFTLYHGRSASTAKLYKEILEREEFKNFQAGTQRIPKLK